MLRSRSLLGAAIGGLLFPAFATAGVISFGVWQEFSFSNVGIQARGCAPNDPLSNFCIPSSGTLTNFLDAPPWTFTSVNSTLLTVVDAFTSGDQFQVFDFGVSLGLTSIPGSLVDCGDDPVPCLAIPAMSQRVFALTGGNHSITITPAASPDGGGAAYLLVAEVQEPGILALAAAAIVLLCAARWRRHRFLRQ